jgi:hypothetical protein
MAWLDIAGQCHITYCMSLMPLDELPLSEKAQGAPLIEGCSWIVKAQPWSPSEGKFGQGGPGLQAQSSHRPPRQSLG